MDLRAARWAIVLVCGCYSGRDAAGDGEGDSADDADDDATADDDGVVPAPDDVVPVGGMRRLTRAEYDATVRDLVNFLVYVGEPAAAGRKAMGIWVLFVLLIVLLPLTYWLKKEFWKDVK